MARAAAATAAAIAPHLVPVIRGATPFAPAAATAAAISLHLVPVIRGATPFSSAVAAAAAAASTPARSSSALTQTLSFPIQAIRSAATSTPPWASSALTQPRYFSTRATRGWARYASASGGAQGRVRWCLYIFYCGHYSSSEGDVCPSPCWTPLCDI
uniref:Uncharacterized protein n=1 Tax=Oryza rufipogon TaxID=4529 RepID=A0A0E0Q471_ORYRU